MKHDSTLFLLVYFVLKLKPAARSTCSSEQTFFNPLISQGIPLVKRL